MRDIRESSRWLRRGAVSTLWTVACLYGCATSDSASGGPAQPAPRPPAPPTAPAEPTASRSAISKPGGDGVRDRAAVEAPAAEVEAEAVQVPAKRRRAAQGAAAPRIAEVPASPAPLGAGGGAAYTLRKAAPLAQPQPAPPFHTEQYGHRPERGFKWVADAPLSTFSLDVDTASYSNVRRMLNAGRLPPADAVRIEELVNYFDYGYPAPDGDVPFSMTTELGRAPWNPAHRLLHVGIRAQAVDERDIPPRNLVFLLDVSGSMHSPDKLPLLKHGMRLLAERLRPEDKVAIVAYAGQSGLVLESTGGAYRGRILDAIDTLAAGGSTNGAAGIELAYRVAEHGFRKGGINRVILATDGDFNVGVSSHGELVRLIEKKREGGVFLTVLGFGTGNIKDHTMEALADSGNGNYAYIDSPAEAHKVLVREAGATLFTVAKDVKIQVEWNPAHVAGYRLLGYDNRRLAARDFDDDTKDAGEVGAGHTVTALYEVIPITAEEGAARIPLKYQAPAEPKAAARSAEWLTLKVRYKAPQGDRSRLLSTTVEDPGERAASDDFRFAAAVAGFGMLLRHAEARGDASLAMVRELVEGALGTDPHGDRRGLLTLVALAEQHGLTAALRGDDKPHAIASP